MIDDTDLAILRLVSANAQAGAGEIGRALGLSQPAAWRRIHRLTEAGIIDGAHVPADRARLGFGVTVFLGIKLAAKGHNDK